MRRDFLWFHLLEQLGQARQLGHGVIHHDTGHLLGLAWNDALPAKTELLVANELQWPQGHTESNPVGKPANCSSHKGNGNKRPEIRTTPDGQKKLMHGLTSC